VLFEQADTGLTHNNASRKVEPGPSQTRPAEVVVKHDEGLTQIMGKQPTLNRVVSRHIGVSWCCPRGMESISHPAHPRAMKERLKPRSIHQTQPGGRYYDTR
jgi:hypothetical protein